MLLDDVTNMEAGTMIATRRSMIASLALGSVTGLAAMSEAQASRKPGIDHISAEQRQRYAGDLLAFFAGTAPQLLRPPSGVLTYPSISPSLPNRTYATSLWDWDTYWTARGLFRFAKLRQDRELHRRIGEHAIGSLMNFLKYQSPDGRLPILITVDKADFFGSLAPDRPRHKNQAKPVMTQLALLLADELQDVQWLAPHFDGLLRFLNAWKRENTSASTGLLVWGDDVAIGNDNDPTTFGRPFFSSANLLLNSLYYQDLQAAAELAKRLHRPEDQRRMNGVAASLKDAIQRQCWDPRDRFFYTADVQCVDRRAELIPDVPRGMPMSWQSLPLRIQTFTGFLPMWCGLATPEQAHALVDLHYGNDRSFHAAGGVRSLSAEETMYSLAFSSNPSNWLGPVWIIVNYLVWKGLRNYGYQQQAAELADKTLRMLADDLAAHGSLNEYYHPDTCQPLSHAGFMDWNLLVLEMIDTP
jgi:putative isomerase